MGIFDILKGDTSSVPTNIQGNGMLANAERQARERYRRMSDAELSDLVQQVNRGRVKMDDWGKRILDEEIKRRGY